MTSKNIKLSVVLLHYNSIEDLKVSAKQLANQLHENFSMILVDNASSNEILGELRLWLTSWKPDAIVGHQAEVADWVKSHPTDACKHGRIYLVTNHENRGYSAGNNIGIRLAESLGADAILIAKPDMRIEDPLYLTRLSDTLFAEDGNYIAASRILGPDGEDQNPLREASYREELFWPRFYLPKFLKPSSYILHITGTEPVRVPKVSGCCLLIRTNFLRNIDYLDESVFLYCEEPILAARVRQAGGNIVFDPSLSAVHAHIRHEKGNSSRRMLIFIRSRLYYLKKYSDYGPTSLMLLFMSYAVLRILHAIKANVVHKYF